MKGLGQAPNGGLAVSLFAIADAVDNDGVFSLIEEDAVIGNTQSEQTFKFAVQGLDAAFPGSCVAVDGSNLALYVGPEANLLQPALVGLADLIHGEAATGNHVFEG